MKKIFKNKAKGPQTAFSKRRSSTNAKKHGLSISIQRQSEYSDTIERIANLILPTSRVGEGLTLARKIAEAYCEVERVRRLSYCLRSALHDTAVRRKQKYTPHWSKTSADLTPYLSRAYGRLRSCIRRFDQYFGAGRSYRKPNTLNVNNVMAEYEVGTA